MLSNLEIIGFKKYRGLPNWTRPWPHPIQQSEEFFESNYFQIGQVRSPITY